jgi:hypothetical protein
MPGNSEDHLQNENEYLTPYTRGQFSTRPSSCRVHSFIEKSSSQIVDSNEDSRTSRQERSVDGVIPLTLKWRHIFRPRIPTLPISMTLA